MNWKATGAFLAVSFFGVGSLVYILFKRNKREKKFSPPKAQKQCVLPIKIPKEAMGLVIGRGGNTIKEIETKSNTRLQIRDDIASDNKICYIRGTSDNVEYAESLLLDIVISRSEVRTVEMVVPIKSCGRIIGKNGENIRLICNISNAKVVVDSKDLDHQSLQKKVSITGTGEQIDLAMKLVEEKVEEELTLRNEIENLASNRSPRNRTKYMPPITKQELTPKVEPKTDDSTDKKPSAATESDTPLEVYVSAVESPDHIWVQVLGPSIVELDKLNDEITRFYSKKENQELHILNEVNRGQIVATTFKFDGKWYRAEVLEVIDNSEDPDVQLYFVDYGDTSTQKKSTLFELRTDFLQLRFQAIECMLAKIKPRDSEWSVKAIDRLEDLTYVALWKSLTAKIHYYKERPTMFKKEGSPVPCIELHQKYSNINVAEVLVKEGFAVWEEEANSSK